MVKTALTGEETDVLNSNPGFAFHCPYDFHQLIITLCLGFLICEMRLCLRDWGRSGEDTQHPEELFQNWHSIRPSLPLMRLPIDALDLLVNYSSIKTCFLNLMIHLLNCCFLGL